MPHKILVVDDEVDLQLLVKQNFRSKIRAQEYDFVFATNGREALDRLSEHPDVALVMSDINMPVMDGLTLLRHIGEMDRPLKSIVVSAYGDTKNVRVAMNRGAFDFVTKPIDFDDLEITLEKTLKEVTSLREALSARDQLIAVRNELNIGQQIQTSFLPEFLPSPEGWEIAARFRPAREVAGDFYDAYDLDADRVGFVIADVCDKGVGAALFMALIRSLLRAFSEIEESAFAIHVPPIQRANDYLLRNHWKANMFATTFFGTLFPKEGKIVYMNGGHNPPVHVDRNGEKHLLKPSAPAVGMFPNVVFPPTEISVEPGEFVFMFTDGVPEAKNSEGAFFSEERLEALLLEPFASAQDLCDRMMDALDTHIGTAKQYDDITMLAIRRLP